MTRKHREEIIDADEAVRRYYEDGVPSETEAFRDGTEPISRADERAGNPDQTDEQTARLSGGDIDVSAQGADAGTEAPGGSNPTPDQDLVDEIGKAVGVTYQDNEPLKFGDKVAERDRSRWELNPASSEDYNERRERDRGAAESPRKRPGSSSPEKTSSKSNRARDKRATSTKQEALMPERKTQRRARKAKREGKAATTQAGAFVREEMQHKKRGKHPVKSRKQAIAIGLSKARRAGVAVPRKRSSRSKRRSSGRKRTKS